MAHPRTKYVALALFGILFIASGYLLLEYVSRSLGITLSAAIYGRFLKVNRYFLGQLGDQVFALSFWCAIALTLFIGHLIPAKPAQKVFSVNLAQDVVWFFYVGILNALVLVFYVEYLTFVYNRYFSRFTITSLSQSPGWARFLIAMLLVDFLYWIQHYCNHKVPLLWQFHKLHHSQQELNFFTDFRYHVVEYIVRYTFLITPFLILKIEPPVIVAFVIFSRCYSHFYHGNIRLNLGPLKYILVTPQSHRVHHSLELENRDRNFGAIFSIWDFIFGTQCTNFKQYPDTGITDKAFPQEQKVGLTSLLLTPLYQLLYPFVVMRRTYLSSAATRGRIEAPP
jgi:sterol desaturase/sphingolipid hydroxylase (fatty acid hydroxylase superfamily)